MPNQWTEVLTETAKLVLVVEDEIQMKRYLTTLLETSDYNVIECETAQMAITLCASHQPDLVLLDLGLPDRDGLTVIEQLREWTSIPIIVISARGMENDKIDALDRGASDYLTKPFGSGELLARMRVAFRHATTREREDQSEFIAGPIRIEFQSRLVYRHGVEVPLTPTEYKLLLLLAHNAGKVITNRQILKEVWGPNHVEQSHYVRVFMSQLRQKLEDNAAHPQILMTETGVGYRLKIPKDTE